MATTRSTSYVIYRHGSNGANQSMTQVMSIGIYTGTGRTAVAREEDACEQAREDHTVYANQWLSAIPATRASIEEYEAAREHQDRQAAARQSHTR